MQSSRRQLVVRGGKHRCGGVAGSHRDPDFARRDRYLSPDSQEPQADRPTLRLGHVGARQSEPATRSTPKAKLEPGDHKFTATAVSITTANGARRIEWIELGCSKNKVVFQ